MSELTCTGTPVSWLRLERLALGELSVEEEHMIRAHLGECAACRACADECAEPVALLPLSLTQAHAHAAASVGLQGSPVLPDAVRPLATVVSHPRFQPRARWVLPLTLGLAAAAALALVFMQPDTADDPARGVTRVVPSDVPRETVGASDAAAHRDVPSLVLLRERQGAVIEDPRSFLVEDRFAIQLTCRPGDEGQQRIAVYQAGEWSLPLTDEGARCGNRVRVPGAFRLSEASPADICVLWGETALKAATARDELPAPGALTEASCQRIEPVAPPDPALTRIHSCTSHPCSAWNVSRSVSRPLAQRHVLPRHVIALRGGRLQAVVMPHPDHLSAPTLSTPTPRAAVAPALTEAAVSARLRGAPDRMLDVGHAQLAYWRFGQGPNVVCVHGWPLHAATWRNLVPLLAGEFTLHLIDLPGAGQSVWDARSRIGIREHAESVREAVAQLGLQRFAYLGHDSGGAITRLAAANDARVFANVIADSEIPGHTPWQVSAFIRLSKAPALYRAVVRSLRFGWLRRSSLGFGGCFTDPRYVDGEFSRWFMTPLTRDARVLEGQTRLLTHFDHTAIDGLREAHAQLHAPSLLLWGTRDGFFPIQKARAMLPQFTAGAELMELPRARLFPQEDHAEAFAEATRAFLRRQAAS